MSHWFHRNPLKATGPVLFDLKQVIKGSEPSKICSELRLCRVRLLDLIKDPNNDVTAVETDFRLYLSLLSGFLMCMNGNSGDSKLRILQKFKWTNSLLGYNPIQSNDSYFELLNIVENVALWFTKHAAKLAGNDDVSEDAAKEVHKCLRKAAGMFAYVLRTKEKLTDSFESGTDLDPKVISAYLAQCTAEAQEVTVARAIELGHMAGLISALANETAKLFQQADESLKSVDVTVSEKWRKYLELKYFFYLAYAYAYRGESLLADEKCGDAIKCLREAMKCFERSEELCKEYGKAKGVGMTIKPDQHLFFRKLRPFVKRILEKCERENGFIYRQKVPDEVPELEIKATHGLVKPEDFDLPTPSELWSPSAYDSFDITKAAPDFSKAKKSDETLPVVKEAPVYQTDKDPRNNSGCTVS